jgi:ATP-binding cassette subfamily F protein uup
MPGACLFVTHDRYFLDRIATRIVELDGGRFFSYQGTTAITSLEKWSDRSENRPPRNGGRAFCDGKFPG